MVLTGCGAGSSAGEGTGIGTGKGWVQETLGPVQEAGREPRSRGHRSSEPPRPPRREVGRGRGEDRGAPAPGPPRGARSRRRGQRDARDAGAAGGPRARATSASSRPARAAPYFRAATSPRAASQVPRRPAGSHRGTPAASPLRARDSRTPSSAEPTPVAPLVPALTPVAKQARRACRLRWRNGWMGRREVTGGKRQVAGSGGGGGTHSTVPSPKDFRHGAHAGKVLPPSTQTF